MAASAARIISKAGVMTVAVMVFTMKVAGGQRMEWKQRISKALDRVVEY